MPYWLKMFLLIPVAAVQNPKDINTARKPLHCHSDRARDGTETVTQVQVWEIMPIDPENSMKPI